MGGVSIDPDGEIAIIAVDTRRSTHLVRRCGRGDVLAMLDVDAMVWAVVLISAGWSVIAAADVTDLGKQLMPTNQPT